MRIVQNLRRGLAMAAGTLLFAFCSAVPFEAAAAKLPGAATPPPTETLYTSPAQTLNMAAYEGDSTLISGNSSLVRVGFTGLADQVSVSSAWIGGTPWWTDSSTVWTDRSVLKSGVATMNIALPNLSTMAPGTYSAALQYTGTSAGTVDPADLSVNLNVKPSYMFAVSPSAINGAAMAGQQSVYMLGLSNGSGSNKPLPYTLGLDDGSPLPPWLSVKIGSGTPSWPISGTLDGTTTTLQLTLNAQGYSVGDVEQCTLLLSTGVGTVVQNNILIPVKMDVKAPGNLYMTASPTAITVDPAYEGDPATANLTLTNMSVVPIDFSAAANLNMKAIPVTPNSGTVIGNAQQVLSLDLGTPVSAGTFHGKVSVTTSTGTLSPEPIPDIPLTVVVKPSWEIGVTPPAAGGFDQRVLLTRRTQASFDIYNSSLSNKGMDFTIEPSPDTPWLKFSTRSGHVTNQSRSTIQLTYDAAGMGPGKYDGSFTILAVATDDPLRTVTPMVVPVSMEVWASALNEMLLQPNTLNVSCYETENASPSKVNVVNPTDMTLDYKLGVESGASPWIQQPANPTGTLLPKNQTSVNINYSTDWLTAGSYTGKVTLTSTTLAEFSTYAKETNVNLTVRPAWEVGITPPATSFDQRVILTRRNQVTFEVYNKSQSNKEMDYTIESSTAWLKFGNKTGRVTNLNRATVQLTYDSTGMKPGQYKGSFKVTGRSTQFPNRMVELTQDVTMDVYIPTPDQLILTPAFLDYTIYETENLQPQTFFVMNPTEMILDYVMDVFSGYDNWILKPQPPSGTVNYKSVNSHVVPFDTPHLLPGIYRGEVSVTSTTLANTNPTTTPINLTVLPAFNIATDATSGSVVEIPITEMRDFHFLVWNSVREREKNMRYHISTNTPWIFLTGKTEGVVSWTNRDEIAYRLDTQGFEPGTYTGAINITAESADYPDHPAYNNVYTIPVKLRVVNVPTISTSEITATGVYNSTFPASQTFTVWNAKVAAMPFTAGKVTAATWFDVSPNYQQSDYPADRKSVTVSFNTAGLDPGEYRGSILVETPTAAAALQKQYINVVMTVTASREILMSPAKLSFTVPEGMERSLQWSIWNRCPNDPMAYQIAPTVNWAAFSKTSGTANGTTPDVITVTANARGKAAGTYKGSVIVSAAGALNTPVSVDIEMIVVKPTQITASPSTLAITLVQGQSGTVKTKITNTLSTAQMTFFMASDAAWLTPKVGSAIASENGVNIEYGVSAVGLAPAVYSGKIRLTVPDGSCINAPFEIPVTLTVAQAPAEILVTPNSLSFSCVQNEVRTFDFVLQNKYGTNDMPYELVPSVRWMTVEPASGTVPATGWKTFKVTVNTTTLLSNQVYRGYMMVVAPNAHNTPLNIPVEVTISDWPSQ